MVTLRIPTPERRRPWAERVWQRIEETYRYFGNSEDGNLYGASIDDLVETPGYWLLNVDDDGRVVAGAIFRAFKGNKMRLVLHNLTPEGKQALRELFVREFEEERCWGEVSGRLEHVLWHSSAPRIANRLAQEILEKPILRLDPDGLHYEREVYPGTIKREMLFGTVYS